MFDCTTEKYDDLYDRWLDKPGSLLDWASYDPAKHQLLDLCGGTGAVAKAALERGAERVWLLDLNPRVKDSRIETLQGRVEDLLGGKYDPLNCYGDDPLDRRGFPLWSLVICRQAIGYLDLPRTAESLASVVAPGSHFVFNTFQKPKWSWTSYKRTSSEWTRRYVEASGYFGRTVFHFQARLGGGGGFDVSSFRWHTDEEIRAAFTAKDRWCLASYECSGASLRYSFQRNA